jgi:hypothetical protein
VHVGAAQHGQRGAAGPQPEGREGGLRWGAGKGLRHSKDCEGCQRQAVGWACTEQPPWPPPPRTHPHTPTPVLQRIPLLQVPPQPHLEVVEGVPIALLLPPQLPRCRLQRRQLGTRRRQLALRRGRAFPARYVGRKGTQDGG